MSKLERTLSMAARWDNASSAASEPMTNLLQAVSWVQYEAQHDPSLISIRCSAWSALLSSAEARSYVEKRGVSLAAFKAFLSVETLQIFDDRSPAQYDVRVAHGEHVYEIRHAVMFYMGDA